MGFVKKNATALAIGSLVLVGGSYVGAKALTAPQAVQLDSAAASDPAPAAADPASVDPAAKPERGPIRGEAVIARGGKFPTVRFNRGTLSSIDGTTLVIAEADGTTVRVDTNDATKFRRDGQKAALADLKAGDHVGTLEMKGGDSYTTKLVRAFSSGKWQQRQSDRADRRAQRRASRGA